MSELTQEQIESAKGITGRLYWREKNAQVRLRGFVVETLNGDIETLMMDQPLCKGADLCVVLSRGGHGHAKLHSLHVGCTRSGGSVYPIELEDGPVRREYLAINEAAPNE